MVIEPLADAKQSAKDQAFNVEMLWLPAAVLSADFTDMGAGLKHRTEEPDVQPLKQYTDGRPAR